MDPTGSSKIMDSQIYCVGLYIYIFIYFYIFVIINNTNNWLFWEGMNSFIHTKLQDTNEKGKFVFAFVKYL